MWEVRGVFEDSEISVRERKRLKGRRRFDSSFSFETIQIPHTYMYEEWPKNLRDKIDPFRPPAFRRKDDNRPADRFILVLSKDSNKWYVR